MSTGDIKFGTWPGPYHGERRWSGTNGKYSGGLLKWNDYTSYYRSTVSTKANANSIWGAAATYLGASLFTANDELELLSKISEGARNHSLNLGIAAAEMGDTLTLALTTVRRISRAVSSVKAGNIAGAARALGVAHKGRQAKALRVTDVSKAWLELQYGWQPLLNDVYESAKALEACTAGPRIYSYTRAISRSLTQKVGSENITPYWTTYRVKSVWAIRVRMKEELSLGRSLGLTDPFAIAWEKVPFSFVADWFIPIGSYLDNLAIIPHMNAEFLETVFTTENNTNIGQWTSATDFRGATSQSKIYKVNRVRRYSLNVPQPQFRKLGESLTTGRLKNAVALLHVLTSKP